MSELSVVCNVKYFLIWYNALIKFHVRNHWNTNKDLMNENIPLVAVSSLLDA